MKFKLWFDDLQKREQMIVKYAAIVGAPLLVYLLLWRPISHGAANAHEQLTQRKILRDQLVQMAGEIQALKANSSIVRTVSAQQATEVVSQSAAKYQLNLSRFEPKDQTIQVWMDEAAFDDMLRWLEMLQKQYGIYPENLSLTKGAQVGMVKAQIKLKTGST